jgi:hypothetical protein
MAREGAVPAPARQAQFQPWIFSYHIFAPSPKTCLSRLMLAAAEADARCFHSSRFRKETSTFLPLCLSSSPYAALDGVFRSGTQDFIACSIATLIFAGANSTITKAAL